VLYVLRSGLDCYTCRTCILQVVDVVAGSGIDQWAARRTGDHQSNGIVLIRMLERMWTEWTQESSLLHGPEARGPEGMAML